MKTTAGEIMEQAVECLASAAAADNLDRVCSRNGTARLIITPDAREVVRTAGIILPAARVGIKLIIGVRNVWRVIRRVRCAYGKNPEDDVRKIDK